MGFNTTTKTAQDITRDVKRIFGDEANVQISDDDIVRWINGAQREILVSNKILKTIGTTDTVANQAEYTLTGLDIATIQSIHFKGTRLEWRSFQDAEEYIMSTDPQKTAIADPTMWYEWGGVINLYPVPQYSETGSLKIYYIKDPREITINDTLTVPDRYYRSVLQYCLAQAYELDEDPENSNFKLQQFSERLDILSNEQNTPEIDTYPRITVLAEDM